jgi:hypothetical protein
MGIAMTEHTLGSLPITELLKYMMLMFNSNIKFCERAMSREWSQLHFWHQNVVTTLFHTPDKVWPAECQKRGWLIFIKLCVAGKEEVVLYVWQYVVTGRVGEIQASF